MERIHQELCMLQSRHDFQGQGQMTFTWRYRSKSKVIICNTPSHNSDHFCKIWKASIENCRFFFSRSRPKNFKNLPKIPIVRFKKKTYHNTHALIIVIVCAKYKKNPSRTVDATKSTWFSKSRLNDLEGIGQGQRSLCVTHPLMVVMICG